MTDPRTPYEPFDPRDPFGFDGLDPNRVIYDFDAAAKAEAECHEAAAALQAAIDRLGDLGLEVRWTGSSADTHRHRLDREVKALRAARREVLTSADTLAAATAQARRDEGSGLAPAPPGGGGSPFFPSGTN